jgi:hypothetical protein
MKPVGDLLCPVQSFEQATSGAFWCEHINLAHFMYIAALICVIVVDI